MSEADASGQRYKNHLDNSNDSVRFQNLWAGSDFVGRFGLLKALQASSEYLLSTTRNLQRNVEAITISMQVLPFSY